MFILKGLHGQGLQVGANTLSKLKSPKKSKFCHSDIAVLHSTNEYHKIGGLAQAKHFRVATQLFYKYPLVLKDLNRQGL